VRYILPALLSIVPLIVHGSSNRVVGATSIVPGANVAIPMVSIQNVPVKKYPSFPANVPA